MKITRSHPAYYWALPVFILYFFLQSILLGSNVTQYYKVGVPIFCALILLLGYIFKDYYSRKRLLVLVILVTLIMSLVMRYL
jgi:hypothetical protein